MQQENVELPTKHFFQSKALAILLLTAAVVLLYSAFLWNPIVFDDFNFFNGRPHPEYLNLFNLSLRWLSYGSLEWTRVLFGNDVIWYRIVNLAIHAANASLLFMVLHKLFEMALGDEKHAGESLGSQRGLSLFWLAFLGAMIFAVHPVGVYATAYLIQRSIQMSAFFMLLMWYLFLRGMEKHSQPLLIGSALAYFLAELCKEHAIMAPAVVLAMLILIRQPSRQLFRQVLPVFLLYGAIALYVLYLIKSNNILGRTYEPRGGDMLGLLAQRHDGFDPKLAYPLSMLTQSLLFFKYLWIWIVPSPTWMSVDMFESFATRLLSWPHLLGLAGFIAYAIFAVRLLLQRGRKGLLGFAMLSPWLLFATELATVRIQESFVLYRSYLWMPGLFAALPYLFGRTNVKRSALLLSALAICLVPITWGRLVTFSSPLLLWDDAARLIAGKDGRPGVDRIYHNRGLQFAMLGYYDEALKDLTKAVDLNPKQLLAFNDRAATYMKKGEYALAVADFDKAIALNPSFTRAYVGRAFSYTKLKNIEAAREDYKKICSFGYTQACAKAALPVDRSSRKQRSSTWVSPD